METKLEVCPTDESKIQLLRIALLLRDPNASAQDLIDLMEPKKIKRRQIVMKEYDLNVTATQMLKVEAETEEEAVKEAFYIAFGEGGEYPFASTKHEIVDIKEID